MMSSTLFQTIPRTDSRGSARADSSFGSVGPSRLVTSSTPARCNPWSAQNRCQCAFSFAVVSKESGKYSGGSLNQLKGRTFRVVFRLTDGEAVHRKKTTPSRRYRNPLILAHEWQGTI